MSFLHDMRRKQHMEYDSYWELFTSDIMLIKCCRWINKTIKFYRYSYYRKEKDFSLYFCGLLGKVYAPTTVANECMIVCVLYVVYGRTQR